MLSGEHVDALRGELGLSLDDEWGRFPEGSPEAALCDAAAARMGDRRRTTPPRLGISVRPAAEVAVRGASTQEAFGRVLSDLSREPDVASRLVTTAPDVAVSTNLGGWINRVGIYGSEDEQSVEGDALRWRVTPTGQHIELGISEMNLFLLLSQLGLSYEHSGHLLVPIGTVYDPFVCRGLDALIYALYNGARFVIAGTPSGISLSREGGAHQSTITPSIGLELPGLTYTEPTYPAEVDWLLRYHVDRLLNAGDDAESLYLRLSTKPVDPAPFDALREARGDDAMRADVLAGGYRIAEPAAGVESTVSIVACGALLPEALAARDLLFEQDEIGASVIALTSPDTAYRSHQAAATAPISNASSRRPVEPSAATARPGPRSADRQRDRRREPQPRVPRRRRRRAPDRARRRPVRPVRLARRAVRPPRALAGCDRGGGDRGARGRLGAAARALELPRPAADLVERRQQAGSERRELVDADVTLGRLPLHEAARRELAEPLGEQAIGESGDRALDLAEAGRTARDDVEDQRGPALAEQTECGRQRRARRELILRFLPHAREDSAPRDGTHE